MDKKAYLQGEATGGSIAYSVYLRRIKYNVGWMEDSFQASLPQLDIPNYGKLPPDCILCYDPYNGGDFITFFHTDPPESAKYFVNGSLYVKNVDTNVVNYFYYYKENDYYMYLITKSTPALFNIEGTYNLLFSGKPI